MLSNGLGELILNESRNAKRIVDLFCGSGAVAAFAAKHTNLPVLATDLQKYSVVLSKAIIGREQALNFEVLYKDWLAKVESRVRELPLWKRIIHLSENIDLRKSCEYVRRCRDLCERVPNIGPIWRAYGGHYFSPAQALAFDYLLKRLPKNRIQKSVCHASLIISAARCAAAPGHTAQPFQPTKSARRYLMEAWERDPFSYCKKALAEVCAQHAQKAGKAYVRNAVVQAGKLQSSDLVVVDPPYSGVQYSRFYHVLETLARQKCGPVSGVGRYPSPHERPKSAFSCSGLSSTALDKLLNNLSKCKTTVILTFPEGQCSNGLSGNKVLETARKYFRIRKKFVKGKFSTLGGNSRKRAARHESKELILLMKPK